MNTYFLRILCIAFTICLMASCQKSDSPTQQSLSAEVTSDDRKSFPMNIEKGGSYKAVDQIRVMARGIIETRKKDHPEPMSILTYAYWNPEIVFNSGFSKPGDYEGYWIKFNEDFTYSYGVNLIEQGKGRYHYSLDDAELVMLDDDVLLEPKVWNVNSNGVVMTFQGRHDFGVNNGMQMKMVPHDQQPGT